MRRAGTMVLGIVGIGLVVGASHAWAHDEPMANASGAQTLTGEVVDVMCYLSHGKEGLGKGHAECGKKCVQSGLPVAIKVGDQLYLAANADHTPANQALASLVGEQVTVSGIVMEKDGQHLVAISKIEKAQ